MEETARGHTRCLILAFFHTNGAILLRGANLVNICEIALILRNLSIFIWRIELRHFNYFVAQSEKIIIFHDCFLSRLLVFLSMDESIVLRSRMDLGVTSTISSS